LIIAAGGCLSLAIAVSAIWYIRTHTALVGLPRDAYATLTFPVFFPQHAPAGFKFDENSVDSQANVLTYTYRYQAKNLIYVSIQPLDPKLDVTTFRPTREIDPSIGHGYLAVFGTRTTVAIVAGKSLVLINSPDGIPDGAIEQFADSLKPVR